MHYDWFCQHFKYTSLTDHPCYNRPLAEKYHKIVTSSAHSTSIHCLKAPNCARRNPPLVDFTTDSREISGEL